jgi:hypothetical protein
MNMPRTDLGSGFSATDAIGGSLPFAACIDSLSHGGDNTSEIRVTNLWPNRLIREMHPLACRHFAHTVVRADKRGSPLLHSGIFRLVIPMPANVLGGI